MSSKASIANLLNDVNTSPTPSSSSPSSPSSISSISSPYDIQNFSNTINNNFASSRFTNEKPLLQQQHQPSAASSSSSSPILSYPNLPQQFNATIINGVQIVNRATHSRQFTGNWLSPLHPLYPYDPPPEMPVYKTRKKLASNNLQKKQQKLNNDSADNTDSASEFAGMLRNTKRTYTKKPHDRLKRPRNGYMIYMNEVYDDVKRKNPHLRFGELSSLIGIQWKEMSKVEQMPYHQRHEEEKAIYESAKLAMSKSNLQIVEETIDIEQQVKAAELKASVSAKNKQANKNNGKRSDRSTDEKQKNDAQHNQNNYQTYHPIAPKVNGLNNHFTNSFAHISQYVPPFVNDTITPFMVPTKSDDKNSRHDTPITPTSPDFNNQTRKLVTPNLTDENVHSTRQKHTFVSSSREDRHKFFKKHFPDLQETNIERRTRLEPFTEFNTITAPQSAEQSMDEDVDSLIPGLNQCNFDKPEVSSVQEIDFDDDEEEQIDELQPSDSEMEGIEVSTSINESSVKSIIITNKVSGTDDTTKIWYLPFEGTVVSPGLSPHRKRKVPIMDDSEGSENAENSENSESSEGGSEKNLNKRKKEKN